MELGFISQVDKYQNALKMVFAHEAQDERNSMTSKPTRTIFTWQVSGGAKQSTRRGGPVELKTRRKVNEYLISKELPRKERSTDTKKKTQLLLFDAISPLTRALRKAYGKIAFFKAVSRINCRSKNNLTMPSASQWTF